MPIRYRCPACQQPLSISSRKAGRATPCPHCGRISVVPSADEGHPYELTPDSNSGRTPAPSEKANLRVEMPTADQREAPPAPSSMRMALGSREPIDRTFEPDAGGFSVRSRKIDADEMDLTPMVDMTFLLLIFFMITASFSVQKSIAFPPPSPDQKGASQSLHTLEEFENNSIIVRIDNRNVIFVDDEPQNDPERVVDVFRAALSTRRNELIVMADENALHETVVAVIDAANAAGMQKIRLAARASE